jgi:hypothetical protein
MLSLDIHTGNMKTFALLILILLPIDNFYLQFVDIKIRVAEIFGLFLFAKILFNAKSRSRLLLPPKSKYLIIFLIITSISLINTNYVALSSGIIYQLHQLILFLCIVSVYNFFSDNHSQLNFIKTERKLFYFFDVILLYGLIQVFFYNVLSFTLRFGMDNWRYNIISYRQDIIDPLESFFENAPWVRPPSVFAEPVFLGLFCTWIFIVSLLSYLEGDRNFKWLYRILASIFLLIFVASRASYLSIAIVLFLYIFLAAVNKVRLTILALVITSGLVVFSLFFNFNLLEGILQGRLNETHTLTDTRIILFTSQVSGFLEFPIFGNGRGMTRLLSDKIMPILYQQDEPTGGWSFWLTLLYDSGLVGAISFIIYFIALFRMVKPSMKNFYKSESKIYFFGILSIMMTGLFFGPLIGGIFWMALLLFYLSTIETKDNTYKSIVVS